MNLEDQRGAGPDDLLKNRKQQASASTFRITNYKTFTLLASWGMSFCVLLMFVYLTDG